MWYKIHYTLALLNLQHRLMKMSQLKISQLRICRNDSSFWYDFLFTHQSLSIKFKTPAQRIVLVICYIGIIQY